MTDSLKYSIFRDVFMWISKKAAVCAEYCDKKSLDSELKERARLLEIMETI